MRMIIKQDEQRIMRHIRRRGNREEVTREERGETGEQRKTVRRGSNVRKG